MFTQEGVYLPEVVPEADIKALEKYRGGWLGSRYGLGDGVALVVVDMTRGFVEDQFSTGWEETGVPCAQAIRSLLDKTRQLSMPIFHTRPSRWTNVVERGRWSKSTEETGEITPQPAEAYDFYPIVEPREGEVVIEKQKPSAFFGTPLHAMLTYHRIDTLIVTGMVTSGCIRATVNDSFSNNFRTIVPLECVADRSQISHQVELFDMGTKYADVVPLADVMKEIDSYAERQGVEAVPTRQAGR